MTLTYKASTKLPSHKVPVDLIVDVVTFLIHSPAATLAHITSYAGKSVQYVRSALQSAILLGLVTVEGNNLYNVDSACSKALGITPTLDVKLAVFQGYLERWEPFVLFIRFMQSGNSVNDAIRKVWAMFPFEGKNTELLKDLVLAWGSRTNIFSIEGNDVKLSAAVSEQASKHEEVTPSDSIAIRLELVKRLGEDTFSFLSHHEVSDLSDAFTKTASEPRAAIESAARAYEDFLRRIARDLLVDVTNTNGIGQLINRLYNNKGKNGDFDNKIHSKHNSIGAALGDIRNMAGHSLEARTLERWELTPEAGRLYLTTVLASIRSIHRYVTSGQYIL